jgi:hypothetical protein
VNLYYNAWKTAIDAKLVALWLHGRGKTTTHA